MKITIIGAGAIGLLLASSLEKHNSVSVLVKKKHYDILKEKGLWIKKGNNQRRIRADNFWEELFPTIIMGDDRAIQETWISGSPVKISNKKNYNFK